MRAAVALACVLAVILTIASSSSSASPGWGLRVVSERSPAGDQQELVLWAVQTPTGTHACVTANYGAGGSSNRPIWLTCDWSTR